MRWLPIALAVSLLANVGLAVAWFGQLMSEGVLETDTRSTFQLLASERDQLQAMRVKFCPANAAPTRAEVLAWAASRPPPQNQTEPFDKDGLLWIGPDDASIKFDADDRVAGVCLTQAWEMLDNPADDARDEAANLCPLEPLC